MKNKFVYSYRINICAGFNEILESIFCPMMVVEVFSWQTVVMLEEVVVS